MLAATIEPDMYIYIYAYTDIYIYIYCTEALEASTLHRKMLQFAALFLLQSYEVE